MTHNCAEVTIMAPLDLLFNGYITQKRNILLKRKKYFKPSF